MSHYKISFTKSLTVFICSVNFMFLCSYCTKLGKFEGRLGDLSCKTERDCVPNAYCIDNSYCMCYSDFVKDTSTPTCLPISKKINDTCKIDLQCTSSFGTHAFCYRNTASEFGQCKCMKNSHFQDGLCYESIRLGGSCKVSDNCVSASNVATYCVHSRCVCAATYHPSDDRLDCLSDIELGQRCSRDEECVAEHSFCSGFCRCQAGYIVSSYKNTCLPAAKNLREQCLEDAQCQEYLPNTFCDTQENNCKCVPFSHELDKSCWITTKLGEPCTHPNQCTIPSRNRSVISCSHGVCSCVTGYLRSNSDCIKLKDAQADSSTVEKCAFLTIAAVILSLPND